MSQGLPEEPMSALGQSYMALHEMFKALVESGFTEDQALKYIVIWTINLPDLPPQGNPDGP